MKKSDTHLKNDEEPQRREDASQVEDRRQKLAEARELIWKYIPEGRSLVDELIQERRDEASREL